MQVDELQRELEDEKRMRVKLEWELVEEKEAKDDLAKQLGAERRANNKLRQRIATLEDLISSSIKSVKAGMQTMNEALEKCASKLG